MNEQIAISVNQILEQQRYIIDTLNKIKQELQSSKKDLHIIASNVQAENKARKDMLANLSKVRLPACYQENQKNVREDRQENDSQGL